jgi:cyclic pyranopterin phosphate synthase
MCKALDKGLEITDIVLVHKTGGASGNYRREARGASGPVGKSASRSRNSSNARKGKRR